MFTGFWLAARWFLLSSTVFIAGLVCAMFFRNPFTDIGDLATWVGAMFTALAVAGAIWIATTSERRRRDELRVRGAIVLPALAGYVTNLRVQCGAIAAGAQLWFAVDANNRTQETWNGIVQSWLDQSKQIPTIPDHYLLDVAAISFEIAGELHATQADIRTGLGYLAATVKSDVTHSEADALWIKQRFQDCYENLQIAKDEIERLKLMHGWPKG